MIIGPNGEVTNYGECGYSSHHEHTSYYDHDMSSPICLVSSQESVGYAT